MWDVKKHLFKDVCRRRVFGGLFLPPASLAGNPLARGVLFQIQMMKGWILFAFFLFFTLSRTEGGNRYEVEGASRFEALHHKIEDAATNHRISEAFLEEKVAEEEKGGDGAVVFSPEQSQLNQVIQQKQMEIDRLNTLLAQQLDWESGLRPEVRAALKRNFSLVEDGSLLLEAEMARPIEERNKMAIVVPVFKGYDDSTPPLPPVEQIKNLDKMGFFFFTDSTREFPAPWQRINTPYYFLDEGNDAHAKNSLSQRANFDKQNEGNMMAKYYYHTAWRVPELRNYRYILIVGGSGHMAQSENLYENAMNILRNFQAKLILPMPPKESCRTWEEEARRANHQERYRKLGVIAQARNYTLDVGSPLSTDPQYIRCVSWMGINLYDSYDNELREFYFNVCVPSFLLCCVVLYCFDFMTLLTFHFISFFL